MDWLEIVLLVLLAVCAVASCLCKNLLSSILIFTAYSIIMSIIWAQLKAPDLAVTETAVGAGVSGILLLVTLKKIHDERTKLEQAASETEADHEENL